MKPTPLRYHHAWTDEEIAFAAEQWRAGLAQDRICGLLSAQFGILISRKALMNMADRHPAQFRERPKKRRAKPQAPARPTERQNAIAERCSRIVELWGQGIAVPLIAERADCSVNYVQHFIRENTDRCPPRDLARLGSQPMACAALDEFGVRKRYQWVVSRVSANSLEAPAKLPVSVAAFSWDAQA